MARTAARLVALLWGLAVAGAAAADDGPALVRVTPALADGRVVCRLQTSGLPGARPLQSMRSGLVAAVEFEVGVVDADDRLLDGRTLTLRLAFDLWDEVWSVAGDGDERRFGSLEAMQAHLADLAGIAVAPAAVLDGAGRCRLRAAMVVHAVAPDERERVAGVIAGEPRRGREGQDQQEASVSLGRLIRLFYRGGGGTGGAQQRESAAFTREELSHAAH